MNYIKMALLLLIFWLVIFQQEIFIYLMKSRKVLVFSGPLTIRAFVCEEVSCSTPGGEPISVWATAKDSHPSKKERQ